MELELILILESEGITRYHFELERPCCSLATNLQFQCLYFSVAPPVMTTQGLVTGLTNTTDAGNRFFSYRGIRYGKPPVGDLRFRVGIF